MENSGKEMLLCYYIKLLSLKWFFKFTVWRKTGPDWHKRSPVNSVPHSISLIVKQPQALNFPSEGKVFPLTWVQIPVFWDMLHFQENWFALRI